MQTAANLLMIKPSCFAFNSETALSNAFQKQAEELHQLTIQQKAIDEFNAFVTKLTLHGIGVTVIEDTPYPVKPDAVFPNNWISFHENGQVFLYPMFATNRRAERRRDIIETIGKQFEIITVTDLSNYEHENTFLEGTGSMVLDRVNRLIYACTSARTHHKLLEVYAQLINYKTIAFNATDENGQEIYHTNVMLCIGERFAVICSDAIRNKQQKENVLQQLITSGHELITITTAQMNHFAGNMLQVRNNKNEHILVLSESAYNCLTATQLESLERYTQLLPVAIPTIETIGGGSARCMIAEIFLPRTV